MKLKIVEMSQADDFKSAVMKELGDLSKFDVLGSGVLVATYVKPEKTRGGIILPDKTKDEDRWQGTIGLVLKMGEQAFKFDGPYEYKGRVPQVGEFVMFHTSDTRELGIRQISCRLIDSSLIRMIVPDPEDLY
jgi:co-chaperonin GroES (HSP10)